MQVFAATTTSLTLCPHPFSNTSFDQKSPGHLKQTDRQTDRQTDKHTHSHTDKHGNAIPDLAQTQSR